MKKSVVLFVGILICFCVVILLYFVIGRDVDPSEDVDTAVYSYLSSDSLSPTEEIETTEETIFLDTTGDETTAAFKNDTITQAIDSEQQVFRAKSAPEVKVNELSVLENRIGLSFQRSYKEKRYQGKRTTYENLLSVIKGGGSSYRLMEFSRGIGALLAMFEATDSPLYLDEILDLTEQLMAKAQKGKAIQNNPDDFKDDYLGWANINPNGNPSTGDHLREYPLHESYLYRYLAKTAYLIKRSSSIPSNSVLRKKGQKLTDYIEKNGWEKWYQRGEEVAPGCLPHLFRNRTHMTSHWGIVALYMSELTSDQTKRNQYNDFLALFDKQLKDNFRLERNAYKWNMTWDDKWPYGTGCNPAPKTAIVQDVSHGNHVVNYIIDSYELSKGAWTRQDIDYLCNTFKNVIYDKREKRFNGDLNGKFITNMADGLRMSDGFVKLARYDGEVLKALQNVRANLYREKNFNFYEAQYVAELILAEKRMGE